MDQTVFWVGSPTTKEPVGLEGSIPSFPVESGLLPQGTYFTSAQGKFLTSLGLSKLFLTVSLHCSSQFFFPFPVQAQVPPKEKKTKQKSEGHTGLSLVTSAGTKTYVLLASKCIPTSRV